MSLHAAPPPPPAGRDVASQRVSKCMNRSVNSLCTINFPPQRPLTQTVWQSFSRQHCCIVPNVKHELIDILVPLLVSDDRIQRNFAACIDKRCLDL